MLPQIILCFYLFFSLSTHSQTPFGKDYAKEVVRITQKKDTEAKLKLIDDMKSWTTPGSAFDAWLGLYKDVLLNPLPPEKKILVFRGTLPRTRANKARIQVANFMISDTPYGMDLIRPGVISDIALKHGEGSAHSALLSFSKFLPVADSFVHEKGGELGVFLLDPRLTFFNVHGLNSNGVTLEAEVLYPMFTQPGDFVGTLPRGIADEKIAKQAISKLLNQSYGGRKANSIIANNSIAGKFRVFPKEFTHGSNGQVLEHTHWRKLSLDQYKVFNTRVRGRQKQIRCSMKLTK